MFNGKILLFSLLPIILIAGCTQTQFVCSDGSVVSDISQCSSVNTTTTIQQVPTETQKTTNLCKDVVCADYCVGATKYYNGQCINGECSYASMQCQNGCKNGQCLTYNTGNSICETDEINADYGMGCIDCISVCNNDHTQMCVGQQSGGMLNQPISTSFSCQKTSIKPNSNGFYVPSNWESKISTFGMNEFKMSSNDGLVALSINMDFPSSTSSWKANKWETYLSNIQSKVTCYKSDGSYALQEGETYNGVQLKDFFVCDASSEQFNCEPTGTNLDTVTKLGSFNDNKYSEIVEYDVNFYSYGITGKPFTLNCKSKLWSGDIPSNIKEVAFTVHFV